MTSLERLDITTGTFATQAQQLRQGPEIIGEKDGKLDWEMTRTGLTIFGICLLRVLYYKRLLLQTTERLISSVFVLLAINKDNRIL